MAGMCRTRAGVVLGLILAVAPVCQATAGGPPAATRTVVQSPAGFDDVLNQASLMLRQRNYKETLKVKPSPARVRQRSGRDARRQTRRTVLDSDPIVGR